MARLVFTEAPLTVHPYIRPAFNSLSKSFKFGSTNPLKGKVTCEGRAQYCFQSPLLTTADDDSTSTQERERETERGNGDLLISNFAADWVEKITPSDVVLLNYILHLQRQLERQVLDLMTQTSQSNQCTRLVEVCALVCVYVEQGGWWVGGRGVINYPLIPKRNIFPD